MFAFKTIFNYITQKNPKTQNPKMEILFKTKKPRQVADFTLDHTGGWGAYLTEW